VNTKRVVMWDSRHGTSDEWRRETCTRAQALKPGLDEGYRFPRLLTGSDADDANQCRIRGRMLPNPRHLTGRDVGCRCRENLCANQHNQAQEYEPRDESYTHQCHRSQSMV